MNERIRELAEQARYDSKNEKHYLERVHNREITLDEDQEIYDKKFAELIIHECLKAIDRTNTHHVHTTFDQGLVTHTINQSKQAVKDHFSDTMTARPLEKDLGLDHAP